MPEFKKDIIWRCPDCNVGVRTEFDQLHHSCRTRVRGTKAASDSAAGFVCCECSCEIEPGEEAAVYCKTCHGMECEKWDRIKSLLKTCVINIKQVIQEIFE